MAFIAGRSVMGVVLARSMLRREEAVVISDLMPFGRNAKITFEHGADSMSEEHYETVTYWYGIDEPMLVLTDEFDVGDKAEERRHNYVSPEASPVDTLISRHELEEDHVPLPESDRRPVGQFAGQGYIAAESGSTSDERVLHPDEKALTVGAWVRPDAPNGVVMSFGGHVEGFSLYLRDRVPLFAIRGLHMLSTVSGSERATKGEWVHLAATLTADRRLRLCVNGKKVAEKKAASFIVSVPHQRLLIGADRSSPVGEYSSGLYWQGLIGEVRVYWGALQKKALNRWVHAGWTGE